MHFHNSLNESFQNIGLSVASLEGEGADRSRCYPGADPEGVARGRANGDAWGRGAVGAEVESSRAP